MGNTPSNLSADALLARIFLFMRRSGCEKSTNRSRPIRTYQVKGRFPEWTGRSRLRVLRTRAGLSGLYRTVTIWRLAAHPASSARYHGKCRRRLSWQAPFDKLSGLPRLSRWPPARRPGDRHRVRRRILHGWFQAGATPRLIFSHPAIRPSNVIAPCPSALLPRSCRAPIAGGFSRSANLRR